MWGYKDAKFVRNEVLKDNDDSSAGSVVKEA